MAVFDFSWEDSLEGFILFLESWNILAVFLGMFIVTTFVAIPSAVVPLLAGFVLISSETLAGALIQGFFFVALPASISATIGSYLVFWIIYYGGKPIVEEYGKYIGFREKDIQLVQGHLNQGRDRIYIFVSRALPIIPLVLISGASGFFRVNHLVFGIYTFLGMLPRMLALALLGWWIKEDVIDVLHTIEYWSSIFTIILVVSILVLYLHFRKDIIKTNVSKLREKLSNSIS